MTNVTPAVLALALACMFTLSAALPPMLAQSVSAKAKPNVPLTLLGKPYRTRSDSQACTPSTQTIDLPPCNDARHDHASAHEVQIKNGGRDETNTDTTPRVQVPFPLVLNTGQGRLRPMRLKDPKRPLQLSSCVDDAPPSETTESNGMNRSHEESPDVSKSDRKQGTRGASMPVRRSKRLYDKGEWKSRLFEEY